MSRDRTISPTYSAPLEIRREKNRGILVIFNILLIIFLKQIEKQVEDFSNGSQFRLHLSDVTEQHLSFHDLLMDG